MTPTVHEGTIAFRGYRTWYRVVGEAEDPGKLPVLCLHGGPGATWHHMEPYEALAEGRRVVFYDQLGCGNSSIEEPHDQTMWTTELYVEEVGAIRDALGLDEVHVLGHSWGGMLGMAYAITQPAGLASLIVESSPNEHPVLAHGAREAARGAAGRRRGDAPRPRGGRHVRRSGVRGGHDGLLPQARVPDGSVAGFVRADHGGARREPRGLLVHERTERVPRDRHHQGLGHHVAAQPHPGADADLLRRARRGHAGDGRARAPSASSDPSSR